MMIREAGCDGEHTQELSRLARLHTANGTMPTDTKFDDMMAIFVT